MGKYFCLHDHSLSEEIFFKGDHTVGEGESPKKKKSKEKSVEGEDTNQQDKSTSGRILLLLYGLCSQEKICEKNPVDYFEISHMDYFVSKGQLII